MTFYEETLKKLLGRGLIDRGDKVLVCCAGGLDHKVLTACGFEDATLSNVVRLEGDDGYAPFKFRLADVERMEIEDGAYDFAIVHEGLHHCASPHAGLLELYRVARKGVLFFEPRDNWFTRLGVRIGFGQKYEFYSVAGKTSAGGLRNTGIPNFVYRWSAREVKKVVETYAPYGSHRYKFIYKLDANLVAVGRRRGGAVGLALRLCGGLLGLADRLIPSFGNCVAVLILKPGEGDLYPWIRRSGDGFEVDQGWVDENWKR